MRLNRNAIFMNGLFLLLLILAGCTKQQSVVAKIDGKYKISLLQLHKNIYQENYRSRDNKPTLSEAKDYLNKLIDRKVLVLVGYQYKLDRDSSLLSQIKLQKQTWMLQELYKRLIMDPFIKESDIRECYSRMGKEVVIRGIFFALSPQANPKEVKRVTEKADSVLKRLKSGEQFSELAKRFSEDKRIAPNGGLVGALPWNRIDDPIQKAAFSMNVGQYSGLIRNDYGSYIIYIEEIKKKEREPLDLLRDQIEDQLLRDKEEEINKQRVKIEKQVLKKVAIRWQEPEVDTLCENVKKRNVFDRNTLIFCLDGLPKEKKQAVLVHYDKGKLTVLELKKMVEERLPPYYGKSLSRKEELKCLIERWLITNSLLDRARKKRLDRSPFVVERERELLEKTMTDRVIQKEIVDKVSLTPDKVRVFYEQEKNKRYSEPERIRIQEILLPNEETANPIYKLALTGVDFEILAQKHTVRPAYQSQKGIFPEIQKGAGGILGVKGFSMKMGEISRPIPLGDGKYSIIKLLEKKAAVTKPFDQIKDMVFRDYVNTRREETRMAFIARKKKEYGGVKIFTKVMEKHFHEE